MIKKRDLIIAVIVSIMLHILVFSTLYELSNLFGTADEAGPMEVYLDSPEGGWRLADIPEPEVQEKPEESKFLGMYNQRVKEETVARSQVLAGESAEKKGNRNAADEPAREAKKPKKKARPEKRPPDGTAYLINGRSSSDNEVSKGSPVGSHASVPEDFYPDYKYGGHTYLNVLRYPEVEYFVRLKRIFKMTWDPVTALQRDMQGTSVSRGAVSCVLAVSVDKDGRLDELFVLRSSGRGGYDQEALRTIRASSPFAAPPAKFLEKDGTLRMSWTFIVYI